MQPGGTLWHWGVFIPSITRGPWAALARQQACQLGLHAKPCGLLNVAGYYDGLLTFLQGSVAQGFMGPWQMDLVDTDVQPAPLLERLVQAAPGAGAGPALRSVI